MQTSEPSQAKGLAGLPRLNDWPCVFCIVAEMVHHRVTYTLAEVCLCACTHTCLQATHATTENSYK